MWRVTLFVERRLHLDVILVLDEKYIATGTLEQSKVYGCRDLVVTVRAFSD